jgi:hypothetical protein
VFRAGKHPIHRLAQLIENKLRREPAHQFELIALTRSNLKLVVFHSLDGSRYHGVDFHDGSAFHIFGVEIVEKFGLCR